MKSILILYMAHRRNEQNSNVPCRSSGCWEGLALTKADSETLAPNWGEPERALISRYRGAVIPYSTIAPSYDSTTPSIKT